MPAARLRYRQALLADGTVCLQVGRALLPDSASSTLAARYVDEYFPLVCLLDR